MKVLIAGGEKVKNILLGVKPRFESSGDQFITIKHIEEIEDLIIRGETFDKAIITEQSLTRDLTDDDIKTRERVNWISKLVVDKNIEAEFIFLTQFPRLANLINEEILYIMDKSEIVVKRPPYSVQFFVDLIVTDKEELPREIIFKYEEPKLSDFEGLEDDLEDDLGAGLNDDWETEDDDWEPEDDDWEAEDDDWEEEDLDLSNDWEAEDLGVELDDDWEAEDFDINNDWETGDFEDIDKWEEIIEDEDEWEEEGSDSLPTDEDLVGLGADDDWIPEEISDEWDLGDPEWLEETEDEIEKPYVEDELHWVDNTEIDEGTDIENGFSGNVYKEIEEAEVEETDSKEWEEDTKNEYEEEIKDKQKRKSRLINLGRSKGKKSKYTESIGNNSKIKEELDKFALRGNSIVFTGCGGCGTSTLAYHTANALANSGYNVLLVDLDTVGRTQNYITKANYISMTPDGSNLRAALNSTSGITAHVSIAKQGLHLLTMGIAGEPIDVEKSIEKDRLYRFTNLANNSYNFVIYDIPFNTSTGYLSEVLFSVDNLVMVTDASNWGITKTMLMMSNIESEDAQDITFNKAQLVFNRYDGMKKLFGHNVSKIQDVPRLMDDKIYELIGVESDLLFSDMIISGMLKYDRRFELGWYGDKQISDTDDGINMFTRLAYDIITKTSK